VVAGLPGDDASVRSIAEYPGHANVLFAGTERALFYTLDSGSHWVRLKANLPTTRYDDIVIHPRTKDLILGTHGRSIWILDDASPIANWTNDVALARAHLFAVPRATQMLYWEDVSNMNHYFFTAENPAEGASFTYSLGAPAQKVRLLVSFPGPAGKLIKAIDAPASTGVVHRVNWDLRFPLPTGMAVGRGGGGEEGGGGGGPGSQKPGVVQLPIPSHDINLRGILVAPGSFKVALEVDGAVAATRTFEVRGDPASAVTLEQQKLRESVAMELADLLGRVEKLNGEISAKRASATGDAATQLQALAMRLVGNPGGGRGRGGGGGRGGGPQPVRQQLSGVVTAMTVSGAQTGTVNPPTGTMRAVLAAARTELGTIEREFRAIR